MDEVAYDLLQKARCKLIIVEPFYGTICMMMNYKESEHTKTMGVCIRDSGIVSCVYNPSFVKSMNAEQLYGIMKHECEHIIRMHPIRIADRMHDAFNVAADFAINGKKSDPRCAYKEDGQASIVPMEDGCFIPEDWPADENAETYYDMLPKCNICGSVMPWDNKTGKAKKCKHQENQGQGQGQGPNCGCPTQGNGNYKNGNAGGRLIDDHDIWKETNVSEGEAKQIVRQMVEQARNNSKGNIPGHLKEFIDKLAAPVVRWKEVIKRFVGQHAGGYRRTYSRRNRRHDVFGIKGISHHAVATLGIIVDTSGSIGADDLRQFFAEIESLGGKTKVWVLMWDAGFCGFHKRYRRGDWKKIPVVGRGGTAMELAQKYVIDSRIPADALIMLTDGITNWMKDPMPMPFFVCLTQDNEVPDYAEKIVMPSK